MAIQNLYPNLPGHLVEFKDGGLTSIPDSEEVGSSKSLLITGTALDGPVMEPVQVSAETVVKVFGSDVDDNGYPNGTTLTKYAKQAFRNGFTDVRCMRVTGSQASATVQKTTETIETVKPGTTISVSIPGNKALKFQLEALPFVSLPTIYYRKNASDTAPTDLAVDMNAYIGEYNIPKNFFNASSVIGVAEYQYMKFKASQQITETVADNAETEIVIPSDTEHGFIYETPVDAVTTDSLGNDVMRSYTIGTETNTVPDTTGRVTNTYAKGYPKVTVNGTVLDLSLNEYSVAKNSDGTFKVTVPSSQLNDSADDTVVVTYEAYDKTTYVQNEVAVQSNFIDEENSSNAITINHDNVNEVVVKVRHAGQVDFEPTLDGYTLSEVDGKKVVTFDPTAFALSDAVEIVWTYVERNDITASFEVRSKYGGAKYNGSIATGASLLKITELTDQAGETIGKRYTFVKPTEKVVGASDKPFYFDSTKIRTVGVLRDELAKYVLNDVFEIVTDDDEANTADFPVGEYYLTGGTDGVNPTNNEMFEALAGKRYTEADVSNGDIEAAYVGYLKEQGAYQILENYHVDFIYSAGTYADMEQTVNPNSSFHNELALLCAALTYRTKMTHGFIDVKPNSNTTLKGVEKYAQKLLSYNNIHYMKDYEGNLLTDDDGKYIDIGWYTTLVVGPEVIMSSDTIGKYYGSPAIAYAALCGQIAIKSAPTNKQIPGCKGIRFKFSNKQMDALTANHMVTFKVKNEGSATATSVPYVVDGCTCGSSNCDYQRISTVKIVTDVIEQIREVADPYLGEENTVEQRNALSSQISKRLSKLLQDGEILNYEFQILATQAQVLIGEASIELTLSVPMELRTIKTTVGLTPAV